MYGDDYLTNLLKIIEVRIKKWYYKHIWSKKKSKGRGGNMKGYINPALLIANSILDDAFEYDYSISPMKLQKLIYFVYKKYLQDNRRPLFNEYFEVWQHGPVLPSVYREFKRYSGNTISSYAYFGDRTVRLVSKSHPEIHLALEYVLSRYRRYGAVELSQITHQEGTAWSKALSRNELYLDDDEIGAEPWIK